MAASHSTGKKKSPVDNLSIFSPERLTEASKYFVPSKAGSRPPLRDCIELTQHVTTKTHGMDVFSCSQALFCYYQEATQFEKLLKIAEALTAFIPYYNDKQLKVTADEISQRIVLRYVAFSIQPAKVIANQTITNEHIEQFLKIFSICIRQTTDWTSKLTLPDLIQQKIEALKNATPAVQTSLHFEIILLNYILLDEALLKTPIINVIFSIKTHAERLVALTKSSDTVSKIIAEKILEKFTDLFNQNKRIVSSLDHFTPDFKTLNNAREKFQNHPSVSNRNTLASSIINSSNALEQTIRSFFEKTFGNPPETEEKEGRVVTFQSPISLSFSIFYEEYLYLLIHKIYRSNTSPNQALLNTYNHLLQANVCSDPIKFKALCLIESCKYLASQNHWDRLANITRSLINDLEKLSEFHDYKFGFLEFAYKIQMDAFHHLGKSSEVSDVEQKLIAIRKHPSKKATSEPIVSSTEDQKSQDLMPLAMQAFFINEVLKAQLTTLLGKTPPQESVSLAGMHLLTLQQSLESEEKDRVISALDRYEKFKQIFKGFVPFAELCHAQILFFQADFVNARKLVDVLLKSMPNFTDAYMLKAMVYSQIKSEESIKKSYEAFIQGVRLDNKKDTPTFLSLVKKQAFKLMFAIPKLPKESNKYSLVAYAHFSMDQVKKDSSMNAFEGRERCIGAIGTMTNAIFYEAEEYADDKDMMLKMNSNLFFNRGLYRLYANEIDDGLEDYEIAIYMLRQQLKDVQTKYKSNLVLHIPYILQLVEFYWIRSVNLMELNRLSESEENFKLAKLTLATVPRTLIDSPLIATFCKDVTTLLEEKNDLQAAIFKFQKLFVQDIQGISDDDLQRILQLLELFQSTFKKQFTSSYTETNSPSYWKEKVPAFSDGFKAVLNNVFNPNECSTTLEPAKKKKKKKKKPTKTTKQVAQEPILSSTDAEEPSQSIVATTSTSAEFSTKSAITSSSIGDTNLASQNTAANEMKSTSASASISDSEKSEPISTNKETPTPALTRAQIKLIKQQEQARSAAIRKENAKQLAITQAQARAERERQAQREKEEAQKQQALAEQLAKAQEAKRVEVEKIKTADAEAKRQQREKLEKERAIRKAEKKREAEAKQKAAAEAQLEAQRQQELKEEEVRLARIEGMRAKTQAEEKRREQTAREQAAKVQKTSLPVSGPEALSSKEAQKLIYDTARTIAIAYDTRSLPSHTETKEPIVAQEKFPIAKHTLPRKSKYFLANLNKEKKAVSSSSPEAKQFALYENLVKNLKHNIALPTPLKHINIVDALTRLEKIPHVPKAFVVGGIVRDTLLGRNPYRGKRDQSRALHSDLDVDLVAGISSDPQIAFAELTKIFPSTEGFTIRRNENFPELFTIYHTESHTKLYQIINSKYLCDEAYQRDPLYFDALSRDFAHNAVYADKDGKVYAPLMSSLFAFTHKEIMGINKQNLYQVENKEFDKNKKTPDQYLLEEDPRRILRALTPLVNYGVTLDENGKSNSHFHLSEALSKTIESSRHLLIPHPEQKESTLTDAQTQQLTKLNIFLVNKVFSRVECVEYFKLFTQWEMTQILFPGLQDHVSLEQIADILEKESSLEHIYVTFLIFEYQKEFTQLIQQHRDQNESFLNDLESLIRNLTANKPLYRTCFAEHPKKMSEMLKLNKIIPSITQILLDKMQTYFHLSLPPALPLIKPETSDAATLPISYGIPITPVPPYPILPYNPSPPFTGAPIMPNVFMPSAMPFIPMGMDILMTAVPAQHFSRRVSASRQPRFHSENPRSWGPGLFSSPDNLVGRKEPSSLSRSTHTSKAKENRR